jgi:hypothetical protein
LISASSSFVKAMSMRAMRRNTKVNTLKSKRTVFETVELEGLLVVIVVGVVFVLFSISKPSKFLILKQNLCFFVQM